ncbi:TetR/AcrR family transcriptional regulator [Nocardia seriolae]|uniref:HTH-type transcriptional regulator YuxN n=1 Tax=Nocardia seriolae TaxID=37332 RepID=A0ABC8AV01_9NOCA|nr:TetR/AcrR family transcriptional regulator [Nocardia seriolae]APA98023.1 putative HTH-type transcriptional regulator YuxN [Nocardia seriolae]OJF80003.1 TetR family transcriptional regulator [Nocardia seriolae]PSK28975.1 TetR family transcriptional regulator [Nocardia seriolae]QOW36062.1 TetR/AcrR family transcriptional regulator [Nocardia seriolae]QUN16440.1 TetR/AcrR family transcriptional regulator [Nocardia seriolae]
MTPHPRRRRRGDDRREQIIDEALKAFADNGYRSTSIAEIADRCGMSQPGLLHYFPNKAALLSAVLDYRDRLDYDRLGFDRQLRGKDALLRLAQLVDHNMHVPGLVRLFTVLTSEAVTADHPAHDWAQNRYRMLETYLSDALRAGITEGSIRADIDPEAIARQVFAMMDGLQLQWLVDPDTVDMATLFRGYIDELIAYIS